MCWNCAYINTRKLCCTVVLTGNETNDSQVLLRITFSCRYETMTDTWEEFPPPIFPTLSPETLYAFVSSRVLRQTHFTLSRWTWTKCSHHTVLLSVIVSTGHASLLFSFFATYILCFCSNWNVFQFILQMSFLNLMLDCVKTSTMFFFCKQKNN